MTSKQGHQRPDLLVETDWLQEYLEDPQLRIVDMGSIDGYKRSHIPNAIGLDHDYFKDPSNRAHVMPPDQFSKAMSSLGIGNEHNVVAYDEWGGLYATRFWWLLRYYGHEKVWVLNGGWTKWMKEGRPWTQVPITEYRPDKFISPHPEAEFVARLEPSFNCTLDRILDNLSNPGFVALDVRSDGEYNGTILRNNRRGGRIPGAVQLEWFKTVTEDDLRTIRPPDELREIFKSAGITPEQEIATY